MSEWNYAQWAETAGIENLKGRLGTGDVLLGQANALLSLLLVGMGSSLAYAIKLVDPAPATAILWGAAAVTAWLMWIAVVLVIQCIVTRDTEVAYNEPNNIYKPALGLTEDKIHEYEIELIQQRINFTKQRNAGVAFWLDRCRYAAIATPVVFVVVSMISAR